MALRNASSKFSMPSFGRKSNANASQPNGINTSAGYDPNAAGASSPRVTSGTYGASVHSGDDAAGGNSGGRGLDGIGRKIGKSIAHTRLIPALGNQDLRLLQE
jgi:hypothetical protein